MEEEKVKETEVMKEEKQDKKEEVGKVKEEKQNCN